MVHERDEAVPASVPKDGTRAADEEGGHAGEGHDVDCWEMCVVRG